MIRTVIAAAAALLLTACSGAEDVTARYALGEGGAGPKLLVKAAANGDARVDSGQQVLVRKGDAEYIVLGTGADAFAAKIDDFVAVMGEMLREAGLKPTALPKQPEYEVVKEGEETIADRKGDVWKVKPKAGAAGPDLAAVLSTDGKLANVGRALMMQVRMGSAQAEQIQGGRGNLEKAVHEMLGKGTVLRFGNALKLESVEKNKFSDADFALPANVLDRAKLKAKLTAERDRARAAAQAAPQPQGGAAPQAPAAPPAPTVPAPKR